LISPTNACPKALIYLVEVEQGFPTWGTSISSGTFAHPKGCIYCTAATI